ncbi:hypothetical protein [Helicobacter sp. T3_23-1056]
MSNKQKNTTQANLSNESLSGYSLALELAKKIREQGRQQQLKADVKQNTTQTKEVKK